MAVIKDRFKDWDILVVEDEPDSMEVAMRWLKLAGANVFTAPNGQDGLKIALDKKPILIISDLTMPVMDGWEMLYEIKQEPTIKDTPVIALTAHALQSIKLQAKEAGFVAHISKPLNPTKFIDQIVEIVKEVPELAARLDK
ncbi:MAG: response regulator [Chloroflexi bacterium]|nr:response regulator [Chloroflexota bacterium]